MLILELNFLMHNFCEIVEEKIPLNEWGHSEFHILCIYFIYLFIFYYVGVCVLVWDLSLDGFLQASSFILSN